jgi:hypothetical protein
LGGGTGSTTRVLYNSVSMSGTLTGGSSPSFALAVGTASTLEIRNNVLANTQSNGSNSVALGFAYAGTAGNYTGLTSTNNAFLVGTGATFFMGQTATLSSTSTTTRLTLAALNTETGQDRPTTATVPAGTSLTLTASPFVSLTDLHALTSSTAAAALNAAALPITGITVDFDNETRSTTTPDIGADEFVSVVSSSTKGNIAGARISVYPNPTLNGRATLELTGFRTATQLTVFDALGHVVSSQLLPVANGAASHTLDLSNVAKGVYLLRLTNTDGVQTTRLVRE